MYFLVLGTEAVRHANRPAHRKYLRKLDAYAVVVASVGRRGARRTAR